MNTIQQETLELAEFIIATAKKYGAEQTNVYISNSETEKLVRTDGQLENISFNNQQTIIISLYCNERNNTITCSHLSHDALERFIKSGINNIKYLAKDPYERQLPIELCYNGGYVDLGLYDENVDRIDFDKLEEVCISGQHTDKDVITSTCGVQKSKSEKTCLFSNGFYGMNRNTMLTLYTTATINDSEGTNRQHYESRTYINGSDLGREDIGIRTLNYARAKIRAKRIASGKYTTVIHNNITPDILENLITATYGSRIYDKHSFLCNNIGEKITSDLLTIKCIPQTYGRLGAVTYTSDGLPARDMNIITSGVLENYFINYRYSLKMNMPTTLETPVCTTVTPGIRSTSEIITSIDKGILITDFLGGNCNPVSGDFSYGIEGFLIENGILTQPINEMLITGNILDLLQNIIEVGTLPKTKGKSPYPALVIKEATIN